MQANHASLLLQNQEFCFGFGQQQATHKFCVVFLQYVKSSSISNISMFSSFLDTVVFAINSPKILT